MPLPVSEWERCRGWLESALEYAGGTHTIGDVLAAIEAGRMMLLAGERSALVVEVVEYPRLKALNVFLAGGELPEVKSFDAQLADIARQLGCQRISVVGRRGWSRALQDIGYRPLFTTVVKEIT